MNRFWLVVLLSLLASALPVAAQGSGPKNINPLTGLPVEDASRLERRPLLVKISNWPPVVRPQSGLSEADHVWEILVEGGVTRFAAVFLGNEVDHLGPVRSARLADLPLVRYYGAIYGYSGAAQGTLDRIRADQLVAQNSIGGGPCPPYCRLPESGLAYEHTLYTTSEALYEAVVEENIPPGPVDLSGLAFEETTPTSGVETPGFELRYRQTTVNWMYDPASDLWLRSQDGEAQVDANTSEQLTAANVAIIEAPHIEQDPVRENYWGTANYAFELELVGEGRALLFRDGRYIDGRWTRPAETDRLRFESATGELLAFKPGNVWFQLVPAGWFNGYQLVIENEKAPLVSMRINGLNLRAGPGRGFGILAAARQGERLDLLGRDASGTWVMGRTTYGRIVWAAVEYLDVGEAELMELPQVINS